MSEVKRWTITDSGQKYVTEEDHECVVAELKVTIDILIESHDARVETIAKQAKVIHLLVRQRDLYRKDARNEFDLKLAIKTDDAELIAAMEGDK